ncbi:MFS transporter, DHA1 family, bicyclomycin/chloramphenicol resistance protein [Amphritea atlantica]|uniref:Bcr/CflA family efflux transporter n=1 Tax=Amphritea atlantica TaxID=355243 RepID=A0A1H9KFL6_9GAMM|nr:multidrug effflux MFS transporter [Amphritea atlantica]SEQ97912.1 MFS transporter, DHA1 family, bicyclomycin/chloramphenicol resistance protein [Amphritea atlantica]
MHHQKDKAIPFAEFVTLIALLISLAALSIDAMLPALGIIGNDLNVADPNDNQLVIVTFFVGMAVGQFLYGPLSDSFGRKSVILFGLVIFAAGTLLSVTADSFQQMLLGRVLQGFGLAGPRVVSVALVRDLYAGRAMARVMSFVMTVFILVPMMAPALGQLVLYYADWRMIFIGLLSAAIVLSVWLMIRMPETLAEVNRRSFAAGILWRGFKEVVSHRVAMGFTLVTGLVFGAFIGYLNLSQPVLQDQYALGTQFPLYFGCLAGAIGLASLMNARLVGRYGMWRLIILSLISITLLSLIYLPVVIFYTGHPPLQTLVIYLFLVFFAVGLLFGNLNSMAMEPLGHLAGIGAGLVSALSTLLSIVFSLIIGQLYNQTIYPLVGGFLVLISIALLICYCLHRYADVGH